MCSRGGLQAAPRLLIIDFEGEVCDFWPLAAPNRIAKIVFVIGGPAPQTLPQIWPPLITLGASFKYIKY